jgi:hypothetical protein
MHPASAASWRAPRQQVDGQQLEARIHFDQAEDHSPPTPSPAAVGSHRSRPRSTQYGRRTRTAPATLRGPNDAPGINVRHDDWPTPRRPPCFLCTPLVPLLLAPRRTHLHGHWMPPRRSRSPPGSDCAAATGGDRPNHPPPCHTHPLPSAMPALVEGAEVLTTPGHRRLRAYSPMPRMDPGASAERGGTCSDPGW